jgi:hypothetical protein
MPAGPNCRSAMNNFNIDFNAFECVVDGGLCCVRGQRGKCEWIGDEVGVYHPPCAEWVGVGLHLYWYGGRGLFASLGRV